MATLDRPLPPPPDTPNQHDHQQPSNPIPSSSPAFATPLHPIRTNARPQAVSDPETSRAAPVLPILLPPAILRPIAFRTFTKKHNLNLTSPALQALATFIGKQCGAAWREDGLAEPVLEEVAKSWKRLQSTPIVEGGQCLKNILKQLEGSMSGGKIIASRSNLSRQTTFATNDASSASGAIQRQDSFGIGGLEVEDIDDEELRQSESSQPRSWLKVVSAFDQPRLVYNASSKHFEKAKSQPTFFPPPSHKTELFRQRYHLLHQRVLRNESFQTPSIANSGLQQWRITSISNLLGRSGSGHLLLGLLTVTPAGTLAISDLTGSIHLDLEQATSIDLIDTWLCPGMIVLVDGVYEEQHSASGTGLGNFGGVGGTIGGRFVGFSIGAPRCETRAMTLGIADSHTSPSDLNMGGSFGWIDFLGLGSERAVGSRMRKIEQRLLSMNSRPTQINSHKVVFIGDCNLDNPQTLSALRRIFESYSPHISPFAASTKSEASIIPLAFVLYGNFTTYAAMSSTSSFSTSTSAANNSSTSATTAAIPDSIIYKESFDSLALLLADFPALLKNSTWIFVPGDNDSWPSSFSAGASTPLPRQPIPDMFTSRIRRAFATANNTTSTSTTEPTTNEAANTKIPKGEVIFTTNPSRLSLFGPSCEIVLFRDDISGRMRRNAIPLKTRQGEQEAETTTNPVPQISQSTTDITMSGALQDTEDQHLTDPTSSPPPAEPPNQQPAQSPIYSQAQSLTKTLLDQHTLSPFPLNIRPLHWSFAPSALSLYPLPTCLVLCDGGMDAWSVRYQGVEVLNAGRICSTATSSAANAGAEGAGTTTSGKGKANAASGAETATAGTNTGPRPLATWVEFDVRTRRGMVRSL